MSEPVIIGDATLYHADCLEVLPTLPNLQFTLRVDATPGEPFTKLPA